MKSTACLLVTCCLEQSRLDVLKQTVDSLVRVVPHDDLINIDVFDNASTFPGTVDILKTFGTVFRCDKNVGYWSAIHWWLNSIYPHNSPEYVYVIESDMIHYDWRIDECEQFMNNHPDIGGVRLHEYKVDQKYLYDKATLSAASRQGSWQSHVNRVTGERIKHFREEGNFYRTNFLTQLPALNRFETMLTTFNELAKRREFTEPDFQKLYHDAYNEISLYDGGQFNCELNQFNTKSITGSWTSPEKLASLGYMPTRLAKIIDPSEYTVTRLV